MPDATRGYIKSLSKKDLGDVGMGPMVVNTYHLFLAPGMKIIKKVSGIHKFMDWDKPVLFTGFANPTDLHSRYIIPGKHVVFSPLADVHAILQDFDRVEAHLIYNNLGRHTLLTNFISH